jgi:hypothetical protein
MTLDQAVALSLLEDLPRVGLTARLLESDPELIEVADSLIERARAERIRAARLESGAGLERSAMPRSCWQSAMHRRRSGIAVPECLKQPAVAIVGSRAASSVALETARVWQPTWHRGHHVVSGWLAALTRRRIAVRSKTGGPIAVLGSGVDHIYPSEHTIWPPASPAQVSCSASIRRARLPLQFHFPMRNRLISGLSRAVVVIEASDKSGSLITATARRSRGAT